MHAQSHRTRHPPRPHGHHRRQSVHLHWRRQRQLQALPTICSTTQQSCGARVAAGPTFTGSAFTAGSSSRARQAAAPPGASSGKGTHNRNHNRSSLAWWKGPVYRAGVLSYSRGHHSQLGRGTATEKAAAARRPLPGNVLRARRRGSRTRSRSPAAAGSGRTAVTAAVETETEAHQS